MTTQPQDDLTELEEACGKPCAPDTCCEECTGYWDRMRSEGYWKDGEGWTARGMREMMK